MRTIKTHIYCLFFLFMYLRNEQESWGSLLCDNLLLTTRHIQHLSFSLSQQLFAETHELQHFLTFILHKTHRSLQANLVFPMGLQAYTPPISLPAELVMKFRN